jgi:L-alanine-DL-glutamate epimerase-like enolase superfamily enzyme
MEIESMSWSTLEVPLKKPFKIALGTITEYRGVVVKICAGELCGVGEASPSPRITGETVGSVTAALERLKPAIIGADALRIEKIMDELNHLLRGNTSAKAAIDFALHDLMGKAAGLPVKTLMGGALEQIPTSLTVTIGTPEESVRSARELLDEGARILKIKIGKEPEQDIERVRAIRNITDAELRVDANQGYSLKRAMKVLRALEKYDIEFAEQPLPAAQIKELEILRKSTSIPIMADEAVHTSTDIIPLIDKVDAINIKLMKSGGLHEARKIASIARAAGMKIMVGCMIETKLGISAGTHLALGIGADYADLDGYWDLVQQPFEGVIYRDGYNSVSDEPGLGVAQR